MDFWDIIVFLLIVFSVIAVGAKYLYKVLNCVYISLQQWRSNFISLGPRLFFPPLPFPFSSLPFSFLLFYLFLFSLFSVFHSPTFL